MAFNPVIAIYAALSAFATYHYVTHVEPDLTWTERAPTLLFVAAVLGAVYAIFSREGNTEKRE